MATWKPTFAKKKPAPAEKAKKKYDEVPMAYGIEDSNPFDEDEDPLAYKAFDLIQAKAWDHFGGQLGECLHVIKAETEPDSEEQAWDGAVALQLYMREYLAGIDKVKQKQLKHGSGGGRAAAMKTITDAIAKMSNEELNDVLFAVRARRESTQPVFGPGAKVQWTHKGMHYTGTVLHKMPKNYKVKASDGRTWRCSPSLLRSA
jgi:hypothetical protein